MGWDGRGLLHGGGRSRGGGLWSCSAWQTASGGDMRVVSFRGIPQKYPATPDSTATLQPSSSWRQRCSSCLSPLWAGTSGGLGSQGAAPASGVRAAQRACSTPRVASRVRAPYLPLSRLSRACARACSPPHLPRLPLPMCRAVMWGTFALPRGWGWAAACNWARWLHGRSWATLRCDQARGWWAGRRVCLRLPGCWQGHVLSLPGAPTSLPARQHCTLAAPAPPPCRQVALRVLPTLGSTALMMFSMARCKHPLALPGVLLLIVALFHAALLAMGVTLADAQAAGWVLPPAVRGWGGGAGRGGGETSVESRRGREAGCWSARPAARRCATCCWLCLQRVLLSASPSCPCSASLPLQASSGQFWVLWRLFDMPGGSLANIRLGAAVQQVGKVRAELGQGRAAAAATCGQCQPGGWDGRAAEGSRGSRGTDKQPGASKEFACCSPASSHHPFCTLCLPCSAPPAASLPRTPATAAGGPLPAGLLWQLHGHCRHPVRHPLPPRLQQGAHHHW